jgi:hypothetical protein
MESKNKIERLEKYKSLLSVWQETHSPTIRSAINQDSAWVRHEVIRAGCFGAPPLTPPPVTGGLIMRNVDPFSSVMFDPPYGLDIIEPVVDMIDRTIGVLMAGPAPAKEARIQAREHEELWGSGKSHQRGGFCISPRKPSLQT